MTAPAAKPSLYSALGSARTVAPRVSRPDSKSVPCEPVSPLAAFRKLSGMGSGKHAAASWMVSIGMVFLGTGAGGIGRPVNDEGIPMPLMVTPEAPVQVEDITMADLPGEPAPETPPDETEPVVPEETLPEEPPVEEDVAEIPDAPPIEDVVPLLEPKPVRPVPQVTRPQPQPRPRPAATPAPARPAAATNTAPGGQGAGGAGSPGNGKGAGGRGKFPQPPYPAAARSQGITGTVTLNIRVNPDGSVSSASVSGSSGSSLLDSHAAAWVQRRWSWPAGGARNFRMPVTFRLR